MTKSKVVKKAFKLPENYFDSSRFIEAMKDSKRRASFEAKRKVYIDAAKIQMDSDAFLLEFTSEIKDARVRKGMTQKELAYKIGISQEEISRIEKGKRNLTLGLLYIVIRYLDLNLIVEKYT